MNYIFHSDGGCNINRILCAINTGKVCFKYLSDKFE